MSNVKFSDVDFCSPDQRVSLTVSSEDENHPVAGIYDDDSRGTTFRTNGYWLIDGDNDTIVFQDVSTDIVATLDHGEYSDTELFAEIKAKMEAVGANSYTVSRNASTKKIRISSDTTGFKIMWTDALSNTAAMLGYNPLSDSTGATLDPDTLDYGYNAPTIALHTEEFMIFDFGSPVNPGYFSALGPSNNELPLSENAVIKLQFNNSSNFSTVAFEVTIPYDEIGLFVIDEDLIADDFYRYLKFKIVDPSNAFGFIELSKVSCGSFLTIDQGAVQFPLNVSGRDFSKNQESIDGNIYGLERNAGASLSFNWFGLNATGKEALEDHFYKKYKTIKSFWIFFDEDVVFSSRHSRSSYYVRYASPPSASLVNVGPLWTFQHNLRVQL